MTQKIPERTPVSMATNIHCQQFLHNGSPPKSLNHFDKTSSECYVGCHLQDFLMFSNLLKTMVAMDTN